MRLLPHPAREPLHTLTPAGSKLAAAAPAWRRAQEELTAAIGPDSLNALLNALLNATAAITAMMAA